jgi:hydrogenase maturation protease
MYAPTGEAIGSEATLRACLLGGGNRVVHLVGVGNPIKQDDGVGLEVVASLRRELGASPASNLRIHPPSLNPENLMSKIASRKERLVVFDAVEANREPGAIVCASLKDSKYGFFATHNLPVRLIPEVAENLDETYVVGIQPESVDVGEGLSEKVKAASDQLVAMIAAMVGGMA